MDDVPDGTIGLQSLPRSAMPYDNWGDFFQQFNRSQQSIAPQGAAEPGRDNLVPAVPATTTTSSCSSASLAEIDSAGPGQAMKQVLDLRWLFG